MGSYQEQELAASNHIASKAGCLYSSSNYLVTQEFEDSALGYLPMGLRLEYRERQEADFIPKQPSS